MKLYLTSILTFLSLAVLAQKSTLSGTVSDTKNTKLPGINVILKGTKFGTGAIYYKIAKCQIQFNVNNLTNKTYWVGGYDKIRMFPGAPRNWMLSVNYTL